MKLIPKNWDTFQHYKDRCPPWIKLHRDLLNDRAFMRLPLASKALAPMLWLLASESKTGEFDASIDELEFRLRLSPKDIEVGIKSLIDNGFFLITSGSLATRLQPATPEREGERETEKEVETEREAGRQTSCSQELVDNIKAKRGKKITVDCPEDVSSEVWLSMLATCKAKNKPITPVVLQNMRKDAAKAGLTFNEALEFACKKQWARFDYEWWINAGQSRAKQQSESFYERDQRLKREEAAKWGGGYRNSTTDFLTIDAEANHVPTIESD